MATLGLQSEIDEAYIKDFEPDLDDLRHSDEADVTDQIARAFDLLKMAIEARGFKPTLILQSDSTNFKPVHAFMTLELLYRRAIKEQGDRFDRKTELYKEAALETLQQTKFDYDRNEDGDITDDVEENASPHIWFDR